MPAHAHPSSGAAALAAQLARPRRGRLSGVLASILLLVAAGVVFAQQSVFDTTKTAKKASGGAQTWYVTGSTGTDSVTETSTTGRQPINGGDTYIQVRVRGSSASSTHVILCKTAGEDGTLDFGTVATATLSSSVNPGGNGYTATAEITFPCAGKRYYKLSHVNASAGTLDIEANTVGAASTAAE